MSAAVMYKEKRQFGRRDTSIRGRAVMSGRSSETMIIRNISDGGALIEFDSDFIPSNLFRIEVEGTDIAPLCEVRHRSAYGIGVRFVQPADGAAFNRHFQLRPVEAMPVDAPVPAPRPERTLARVSNLDTRTEFLVALAKSIGPRR